jgi:predicted outer membrane repeat protein
MYHAMMYIGAKARVVFMNNTAGWGGGAVFMMYGMITVGAESCVIFEYNHATHFHGGAINLLSATLIVDSEANLTFSHNSGTSKGGALMLTNTTVCVNKTNIEFYDNRASLGGAIYFAYATMIINISNSVKFIMNSAQARGGAIYIEPSVRPAIIVDNYSKLLFFNNSAFQGGALYNAMPSLLMTTVGYQSSIQFINNTAFDVGGAVYSQSSQPCIFTITDYSTKISFIGNHAQHSVGHHMYGASVRDDSCIYPHQYINLVSKPHCFHQNGEAHMHGYINIFSFDPGLNETLSPVSSAPQRVCLCDSNGKPQCANISYIFTNISVYRGETITLPVCIVGYDFGTTVGTIHARSLYSDSLSKRDKSQPVFDSEKCVPFNYTVDSKSDYELLLLQTSSLPVSANINNESTEHDILNYKHI